MSGDALLYIAISLPALAYVSLIAWFTYGWDKTPVYRHSPDKKYEWIISIIIPVRNEHNSIEKCLSSLTNQNYPVENYEIILIDDHSDDKTMEVCRKYIEAYPGHNWKMLCNEKNETGKKQAIAKGLTEASGKLIITTDADSNRDKNWISAFVSYYEETNAKMIIGPVVIKDQKGILQKFQTLEFMSLIGTTAGAAGIGKPIMCNGANLFYERDAFFKVDGFKDNDNQISGDDIFLLMKIKKEFGAGAIRFLKDREAIVFTNPKPTLLSFINQRLRWVSKSSNYTDPFVIVTALVVFLFNLGLLFALILLLVSPQYGMFTFILWILKFGIDFPLLSSMANFFKNRRILRSYLFIQILTVIYTSLIGIAGHIVPFKWKGR